jgi:hypothetical protein
MAKQITEAKLKEAAFDLKYEFTRFRMAWKALEVDSLSIGSFSSPGSLLPGSFSTLGNNNASAVVDVFGVVSKSSTPRPPADPDKHYALVEHTLIHFRILIEFFFHHTAPDDYVLASDFACNHLRKTRPKWVNEYEERCNDLIAHLSYERIGYRQRNEHHWKDILDKCKLMDEEITNFLTALEASSPARSAWFG